MIDVRPDVLPRAKRDLMRICSACGANLKEEQEHRHDCPIAVEKARRYALEKRRGAVPMKAMFLAYGIVLCIAAAGLVAWRQWI